MSLTPNLAANLAARATQMGLLLDAQTLTRCENYVALLRKWNRVHNLTAVDSSQEILTRHLLDSLSAATFIRPGRCLDVGSGAGLPGMVLAMWHPANHWTLLEARAKKASFLREATARLALDNIEVAQVRTEDYRPTTNFDTLIARAVAPLGGLLRMTSHLMHDGLRIIAMKGAWPTDELRDLPVRWQDAAQVVPVVVPGLNAQRHLVILEGVAA
ncbi:MAG: 16S rRNA (guanine(527)-N(7))-methyltransferase RsmG [Arenicellales bacterium]|nr:16S rRNA (guanine(527)-N(7))-methyltransferase RsmG [Arenicellales bacterium]